METSLVDRQRISTKEPQWNSATLITQSMGATLTTLGSFGFIDDGRQQLIAHLGAQDSPVKPDLRLQEGLARGQERQHCPRALSRRNRRDAPLPVRRADAQAACERDRPGGTIDCIDENVRQSTPS